MNKVANKLIILLACLMTVSLFFACFGPGGQTSQESGAQSGVQSSFETEEKPDNGSELSIKFNVLEKNVIVGDEEYVLPEYKKVKGYTLSFASSNASAVSVDANGKISAQGEGSAIITATYSNGSDEVKASFVANSSFGGYLPELKAMGVSSNISIALTDSYKLLPYVVFNGKQFSDATVTYSITDSSVAEVDENGLIVAKANGEAKLIIEASWRGKTVSTTPTLKKVIDLSVIDDVRFYNAGEAIADEVLYTFAEFEGKSYKNSLACDFTVQINGVTEEIEATIEDESVVTLQGNKIVVNSFGSTTVLLQKTINGKTYSKTFNITVERVEKKIEEIVPLFGTVDGEYLELSSGERRSLLYFINDNDEIVDAYQGLKQLKVVNNQVHGVESSSLLKRGEAEIVVGTSKVLYTFTLETLAKALTVKEDLKCLELSGGARLEGYYELMNDIDASGLKLSHDIVGESSFTGVFDGKGHAISNLTLSSGSSLFGVLDGASATVKNLALVNLTATKAYFLAHNTLNDGLVVSDVYVALSEATSTPRGLTGRTGNNSVCKNVVIEYLGENANANRVYNERWSWQGLIGGLWTYEQDGSLYARDSKWSDVYVISPFVVSFRSDEKKDGDLYAALYGYGANVNTDIYGNTINGATNNRPNPNLGDYWQTTLYYNAQFTNLYQYNSYEALVSAGCDFSSFSSDYWVVYNNKVIWKSLFNENVEIAFLDGNTNLGEEAKLIGVGSEINVKAFAYGKELSNVQVSFEDSSCVTWSSSRKTLKLTAAPAEGAKIVEVIVTVNVGNTQIVKKVNLMIAGDKVTYNVTLNAGEGSVNGELTSYVCGEGAVLPTCSMPGYDFVGWYTTSDFSGEAVTEIKSNELGDKTFYAKYKIGNSKYTVTVLVAQYNTVISSGICTVGSVSYVDRTQSFAQVFGLDANNKAFGQTLSTADLSALVASLKGARVNLADSILTGTILADGSLELLVKLDFDEAALGFNLADIQIGQYGCENLTFTLDCVNGVCGLAIDGTISNGKEIVIGLAERLNVADYATITLGYYEKSANTSTQVLALASKIGLANNATTGHIALVSSSNPAQYVNASVNLMEKFPELRTTIEQINVKLIGGGEKHVFISGIKAVERKRETVTYSIENGNLANVVKPLGGGTIGQAGSFTFGNAAENINVTAPALRYTYEGSTVADRGVGIIIDLGGIKIRDYKTIKFLYQITAEGEGINYGANTLLGNNSLVSLYGGAHIVDVKALAEDKGFAAFDQIELSLSTWSVFEKCNIYLAFIELEIDENAPQENPEYNVTLNANGGMVESPLKYYEATVGAVLPSASKTGYTFAGWYENADFSGEAVTEISASESGDKTFYAKWTANTYSVTLNAGDGVVDGELTSYVYGVGATLPVAFKEGHNFLGWYENSDFSGSSVVAISATDLGDKVYYAKYSEAIAKYTVTVLVAQYSSVTSSGISTIGAMTYVDRSQSFAWAFGMDASGQAEAESGSIVDLTEAASRIKGAKLNADSILSGTVTKDGALELVVKLDFDEEALGFKLSDVKAGQYGCENLTFTLDCVNGACGLAIDGPISNGKEIVIELENRLTVANYASIDFKYYEKSASINTLILVSNVSSVLDNTIKGHVSLIGSTSNPTDYVNGSINIMEKFASLNAVKQINVKFLGGGEKHVFIAGVHAVEFKNETVTYSVENGNLANVIKPLGNGVIGEAEGIYFSNTIAGSEVDLTTDTVTYTYVGSTIANRGVGIILDLGGIRLSDYKSIKFVYQIAAEGESINYGANVIIGGTTLGSYYGGAHIIDVKALAEAKGIESFAQIELSLSTWSVFTKCTIHVAFVELVVDENAPAHNKIYSVDFETNGGELNGELPYYEQNVGATLPTASKEGYTFAGWFANSDLTGEAVTEISASESGDKAFYAKWVANSYSVTLNAGDGVVDGELASYVYGVGATLPAAFKEGHTFLGWYENADFSGSAVIAISASDLGDKTYYAKYSEAVAKYTVTVLVAQYPWRYDSGLYFVDETKLTYVDRSQSFASVFGLDANNQAEAEGGTIVDLTNLAASIKGAKLCADSILSGTVTKDGALELLVKLDFDEAALGFKLSNVKLGKWSCDIKFTLDYLNGACGLAIDGDIANGREIFIELDEALVVSNYSAINLNYYEKSTITNTSILVSETVTALDNSVKGHKAVIGLTKNPSQYINGSINIFEQFHEIKAVKQINIKFGSMDAQGNVYEEKHVFIGGLDAVEFKKETVTYSVENGNLAGIVKPLGTGVIGQAESFYFANNAGLSLTSPAVTYTYVGSTVANRGVGVVIDLGGLKVSDYKTIKIIYQIAVEGTNTNYGANVIIGSTTLNSYYGGGQTVDVKALADAKGISSFEQIELSLSTWSVFTKCTINIASIELVLN